MTTNKQPRGIRNNNPGNIRYTGTQWVGLSLPPSDGEFCIFTDAKYGIRALSRVLKVYKAKYGICTVAGIINRWAPAVENNTRAYIESVCKQLKKSEDERLDLDDNTIMLGLIKAITRHENGVQPYSDADIIRGLEC